MKGAELGAKCLLSCGLINQAVVPATGLPSPSVQSKAAPPQSWTSIPRCRLYQACRAGASLALKKMPPMPVTRFIEPPTTDGGERCVFYGLAMRLGDVQWPQTKALYFDHRLPPELTEAARSLQPDC